MKHTYKILQTFIVLLSLFTVKMNAQNCIQTTNYPSGTLTINTAAVNQIATCNYAGEYSINSFTATGNYTCTSTGGSGNYITITDASNNPLISGPSPLAITIPSVGVYFMHISLNNSCATESACRVTSITGPSVPAPPANDQCSNAIALAVPSGTSGTTVNATVESPAPGTCGTSYSQPGVWYKVVGNGNQFGADLCSTSAWDSKIFVYTGTCGAWSCVTGDDDAGPICPTSAAASVTWCSVPTTTYYILVTGYSSASAFSINVTQTVVASPTVVASTSNASVCLTSTTSLSATGAVTYSWSTGATTASLVVTPTASTVYTVTGRSANGCMADVKTVTITSLVNPTIAISANTASICPAGSVVITATGANSYTFSGLPSGTFVAASATLSPLVNTIYTVSGTASNGCKSLLANSPTATITTLTSPTLVVSASSPSVCPSITTSLSVTGASTYTWLAPSSNATQVAVNPAATTVYTVSGTGTTVCNGFKTFTVFVYPTPTIAVNSGSICAGAVFTMVPSGASTYTFSSGSNTVSPATNTVYNVVGTSANGCLSSSTTPAVASVSVIALPTVVVSGGTVCAGSPFVFLPTGATSYTFVNSSNPITPTASASYSVIGSTSIGCVSLPAIANLTVFSLPSLSIVATPSNNVVCANSPLNLTASGATTYTWNNTASGATFSGTPQTSGSYFVIGTDANGCTNLSTVPYTVNPQPPVSVAASNTFLCVGKSATLTAAGALTYTWTTTTTTNSEVVTPTVTTIYGVTGTNTFNCTNTATLSIVVNTINMTVSSNTAICKGNSADLSASGASAYTWTPGNSPFPTINVNPSATSVYTVTGKDSKNCIHTAFVTVTVNANPTVTATGSSSVICVGESATLSASGASSYSWTSLAVVPTSTGNAIVVSPSSSSIFNYYVTGTDANGCSSVDTIALKVDKCTGITKITNQSLGLSVYPNPTTGEFTVELNNGLTKNIQITDVTGRVILTEVTSDDKTTVNLNAYSKGIYYVKIQSDNAVEVIKVIKN